MKEQRTEKNTAPLIPNLSTRCTQGINFTPQPLYVLERSLVPLQQEARWPPSASLDLWRRKHLLPLPVIEPHTVQLTA